MTKPESGAAARVHFWGKTACVLLGIIPTCLKQQTTTTVSSYSWGLSNYPCFDFMFQIILGTMILVSNAPYYKFISSGFNLVPVGGYCFVCIGSRDFPSVYCIMSINIKYYNYIMYHKYQDWMHYEFINTLAKCVSNIDWYIYTSTLLHCSIEGLLGLQHIKK